MALFLFLEKIVYFLLLNVILGGGFFLMLFIRLRKFSEISTFLGGFKTKDMGFCQTVFLQLSKISVCFSLLVQ